MASRATQLLFALAVAPLPSWAKIPILRLFGASIGRHCKIGLSIIDASRIDIGDNVQIGSFNIIHRLKEFKIGSGGRINNFNWITGAGIGSLLVGRNSAITRLHFFEASTTIMIGENSIIAGRGSHFFTHGISSRELEVMRPIQIGDWCYVGSSSRFVPGASVAKGTFVGMGSVVTKNFEETFVLVAGSPASVRKSLDPDDTYFSRKFLPHDHHLPEYKGG